MTLLLWIGVAIVVIAAIIKNMKENVVVFHPGRDPDNPFEKGFPPFGKFPNGFPGQGKQDNETEQMVCCEHCKVFVPVSQSIKRAGHIFCSQEHAAAWFSSGHQS